VLSGGASAQGLTYDMAMAGTYTDPRSGQPISRPMMAAHGQFADGNARIDYQQVGAPTGRQAGPGLFGPGTYIIVKGATHTSYFVDPTKREYMEFNSDSMSKLSEKMQASLGGLVKTEWSDVSASGDVAGPGEPIEGYSTIKYHVVDNATMTTTIMGRRSQSVTRSTTDIWIAPKLSVAMNPMGQSLAGGHSGANSAYTDALTAAYTKLPKGAPLKTVTHSESVDDGKTTTSDMTMTIAHITTGAVSASVFELPADYKKNDLFGQMSGLGALGDSLNKARAASHAASPKTPVAQGVSEGVNEQAKEEAKTKAKSVVHNLLHP
jgi:hypothetical protein